jgi:hypothetical protein
MAEAPYTDSIYPDVVIHELWITWVLSGAR